MNLLNKRTFLLIISSFVSFMLVGQIPVGSWREHLPYNNGKVIAVAENRIYCATDLALFYYDKNDNAVYKMSKINKLSDLEVGYTAYSDNEKKLIIGYINGNIDIIENDTKYNFPDIKLKNIIADKSIYHILMYNEFAYIATGFGIVVFNLEKNEFADTYIIGQGGSYLKINNTAIYNNEIYALTDNGVYKGSLDDPFLGNYENWTKVNELLKPNEKYFSSAIFNNSLLLVNTINNTDTCHLNTYNGEVWDTIFSDLPIIKSLSSTNSTLTIVKQWHVNTYNTQYERISHYGAHYAQHAIYDKNDDLWIADSREGLLLHNKDIYKKIIMPDGPASKNAFKVFNNNGIMLIAPGGYAITGHNSWIHANVYDFTDEMWHNLADDTDNNDSLASIRDVIDFASQKSNRHYFAATWNYGLVEVEDNKIINTYNSVNTLELENTKIGGIAYDKNGNLHIITNSAEHPFVVKTPDNNWYNYTYSASWATSCRKLINTNNNDKWAISNRGKGIFVWNDNGTPEIGSDDIYKEFDLIDDDIKVIDSKLNDIVEDVEGALWIATSNGVAMYDYPQNALRDDAIYARVPQLVVDGYLKGLLEGENVTTIAVDGANRKWLGTEGGGLFLVSADGTEQIISWNTDNSKLFSNNIVSIDINQKTGEVFIGTDKGLQSYKSTSSENRVDYSDIYTFPNPVKGDYNGVITIRGLMYETNVKITDLSGHKVYETLSNGGDAIWNGKDLSGSKVAAGIYLVMCALPDGSLVEVSKILIVK